MHRARRVFSTMERVATAGKTTSVANKLKVGPLKKLYKYMTPGAISLAGGLPMDTCFPFKSIDVNLEGGEHFHLENSKNLLMNYTRGDGIAPLKAWVTEHVNQLHNPREGTESCVTVGSSDAWAKILQLVDTEAIMYDNFAYGTAISIAEVMGKKSIGVPFDEHGMIPEQLRQSVQEARSRGLTVNLIYMIPVGQNPVGITMPTERKEELYRVCQELDLLIAEDDAYYYLHYNLDDADESGIEGLPRSFLSMDTDGRVLRLDSLSKLVAPGMRMGWISGPSQFIEKYMLLQECTAQFPSGLSQSIFTGLTQHHGHDGFNIYAKSIQRHYKSQCKVLMNALAEHFPPGFVQYTRPAGGMFLWLTFPSLKQTPTQLFEELASTAQVICVPGDSFYVPTIGQDDATYSGPPCIRLSFAYASPEKIGEAIAKMAPVLLSMERK